MLKIKDNIDLKELEKYGFKLSNDKTICEYGYDKYDVTIYFSTKNRILKSDVPFYSDLEDSDSHLEVLYDLIKDGLVEKVED